MVNSVLELDGRTAALVSSGGNVGIGTASPQSLLHLASAGNALVRIDSGSGLAGIVTAYNGTVAAGAISLFPASDSRLFSVLGNDLANATAPVTLLRNGNFGIGTTSPGAKLEVNGTVKAAKLDSAAGEIISIYLNQCGGACAGNHTLNVWTNVGTQNYNWATAINTATDNFAHDGKGNITVAKAGLYRIRLQAMFIPSADTPYGEVVCPFINGTANCGYNGTFSYNHRYAKANWWSQPQHEFVFQLTAGSTVAW
jgi:hypothetical protein